MGKKIARSHINHYFVGDPYEYDRWFGHIKYHVNYRDTYPVLRHNFEATLTGQPIMPWDQFHYGESFLKDWTPGERHRYWVALVTAREAAREFEGGE